MALRIYEDTLDYVRRMRPVVKAIERHDPDLAKQMKKALASAALNTAEGERQRGGKGRNRFLQQPQKTNDVRIDTKHWIRFSF